MSLSAYRQGHLWFKWCSWPLPDFWIIISCSVSVSNNRTFSCGSDGKMRFGRRKEKKEEPKNEGLNEVENNNYCRKDSSGSNLIVAGLEACRPDTFLNPRSEYAVRLLIWSTTAPILVSQVWPLSIQSTTSNFGLFWSETALLEKHLC